MVLTDNIIHNQEELLTRISEGNELAFATLYKMYARKLLPFIVKLTGSKSAAEDIIQNTFLSVWLNRDKLLTIENLNAYIYRIAANNSYTWLAKNKIIRRTELQASAKIIEAQDTTSQQILFNEAKKLVDEAIRELPSQRKKIFQLYRENGLKYKEIAGQLDISPSTVRTSVSVALEHIRIKLTEAGLYIFFILFFGTQ